MLELALDRQWHYNLFMIQFGAMNCRCGFYRKQDTVDVEYDFEVDAIFFLFARWMAQWMAGKWDRSKGWGTKIKSKRAKMEEKGKKKEIQKDSQSIYFHRFLSTKMRLHNSLENLFPKERQRKAEKHPSLIEPFGSSVCTVIPFHSKLDVPAPSLNKNKDETQPLNALFAEKSISGN